VGVGGGGVGWGREGGGGSVIQRGKKKWRGGVWILPGGVFGGDFVLGREGGARVKARGKIIAEVATGGGVTGRLAPGEVSEERNYAVLPKKGAGGG